jgi:hypothetical protein
VAASASVRLTVANLSAVAALDDIKLFHNQDAEYEDWVAQHGGYVLTDYSRGPGFSLHTADCYHLGPYMDESKTTKKPRRWAASAHPLREWAQQQTGERPTDCPACMGTTSPARRRTR